MYEALLEEMAALHRQRGRSLLQLPALQPRIDALRQRASEELEFAVPEAYVAFLRKTDGLDFNGPCVYACDRLPIAGHADRFIPGFVDVNLDWRGNVESLGEQVDFAHDGMTNFVYHQTTRAWQIRSMPSDDLLETVDSFEALILRALEDHRT